MGTQQLAGESTGFNGKISISIAAFTRTLNIPASNEALSWSGTSPPRLLLQVSTFLTPGGAEVKGQPQAPGPTRDGSTA